MKEAEGCKQGPGGPDEPLWRCSACHEDVPATGSIACKAPEGAARHFLCHPCLEQMVRAELGDMGKLVVGSHCSIRCPSWNDGCAAEPWTPAEVQSKLTPEGRVFYVERLVEQRTLLPPEDFFCPISQDVMTDPVMVVETGHSYERAELQRWFAGGNRRDPITNTHLRSLAIKPNHALRKSIETWRERYGGGETAARV